MNQLSSLQLSKSYHIQFRYLTHLYIYSNINHQHTLRKQIYNLHQEEDLYINFQMNNPYCKLSIYHFHTKHIEVKYDSIGLFYNLFSIQNYNNYTQYRIHPHNFSTTPFKNHIQHIWVHILLKYFLYIQILYQSLDYMPNRYHHLYIKYSFNRYHSNHYQNNSKFIKSFNIQYSYHILLYIEYNHFHHSSHRIQGNHLKLNYN